jgi:hypothetical protein
MVKALIERFEAGRLGPKSQQPYEAIITIRLSNAKQGSGLRIGD